MKTLIAFLSTILIGMTTMAIPPLPKQLTSDAKNHSLDNNDNFSPDDRFLAYDTRPDVGLIMEGKTIEKVEIATGEVTIIYNAPNPVSGQGPGVGAVSYHPKEGRVVFIHGPFVETGLTYGFTSRYGAIVSDSGDGQVAFADARDVTEPYTTGALRGGTHRHEFDGSGQWIGYTYNDSIMKSLGVDLRSIGVTKLGHPITVDETTPGNMNGLGFSAIVVHVVPNPKPGSEEISRAAEDSWVGTNGYKKVDGTMQLARGFIGSTSDSKGNELKEVYIVDIPQDITQPGPLGPLEGTAKSYPAPPKGASQRRLTHTENWNFPGCKGNVKSHPDGHWLAFQARDDNGNYQIYLVSPNGGQVRQLSRIPGGVLDGPRWLPSGKAILTVDAGKRLVAISTVEGASFGSYRPVFDDQGELPYAYVVSHDGRTIAFNRAIPHNNGSTYGQIFVVEYQEGPDGLPVLK